MITTKLEIATKSVTAINHVTSAINTFINAEGDAKQIASGCLDIVNAMSVFLMPPVSELTAAITSIANLWMGGGTEDTATLIQDGFDKQAALIVGQLNQMKKWTDQALDTQTLEEMTFLAEVSTTF